jgi:hypothetical protein
MRTLTCVVSSLVFCVSFCSPMAGQPQAPRNASFLGLFNQEAAASDPAGIQKYSEDIIELIVPERVGKDYIRSLSERLAKADQRAREGKGNLVPESAIARSFDELMQGIGAPPAWRADVTQIRKFRARSVTAPNLSALFTAGRNGTNCNPGEAVLLLYLLILNNGKLIENSSDFGNAPASRQPSSELISRIEGPNHDSSELLAAYGMKHSHHHVRKLFDHVAQTLGF